MSYSNEQQFDLMLCGGGVIGLSIAYECASNGWRVLVVDSNEPGASSWAGAGILPSGATQSALDPIEQLRSLSHRLHRQWASRLLEETGIDNEYRACGGLYLASSAAERATLAANHMWWDEHGIRYESWKPSEVVNRVPALQNFVDANPQLKSWFFPDDCRVRNPRHLQSLNAACKNLGVTILAQTHVDGFEIKNDRVCSAISGNQRFVAERYCVTTGAWASQLLGPIGIDSGVMPVRGQMVLYKLDAPIFPMVINDGHRYLVPRDDGHVLAGSCEEEVGFDPRTTPAMIEQLHTWANGICPALTSDRIARTWAGLRPGSFDSYPYLGTLHPFENAFIAAGHFRHGLHWSPATALLMFQWMSGQPTEIDLGPFCVQRGQTLGSQLTLRA